MGTGARVDSIDALKAFRVCLVKFAEAASVALADAEGEMLRTQTWLETEARQYWQGQIRKRHEMVEKCKEAVRMKKLFKDSSGRFPSAVDEEKALATACKRLEEAEQKLVNVKRYTGKLQKEIDLYKGSVQRFATSIQIDVPAAGAKLEAMVRTLQEYVALRPVDADLTTPEPVTSGDFARSTSAAMAPAEPQEIPAGPIDPTALRGLTPLGAARAAAVAVDLRMSHWAAGVVSAGQADMLKAAGPAPAGEERLTVADTCWSASHVYLHRVDPAFPGDSGWHIGPADGNEPLPPRSAGVADLLDVRPDLRAVLALPAGSLVVLDRRGLAGAFDGADQSVLPAE